MRNLIQLKQANRIEVGEHVLTPQYATGILLADRVIRATKLDKGLKVELATKNRYVNCERLHVVGADDMVVVVI
jgi:hypothetical protein